MRVFPHVHVALERTDMGRKAGPNVYLLVVEGRAGSAADRDGGVTFSKGY